MPTAGVSASGVASLLLAATTRMWGNTPPPVVKVNTDGAFLSPWGEYEEDGSPPCKFYNTTYQYTGALCSHFALARMGQATQQEALNRALSCAAYHETDCILSPEVGLSVPAPFVYDPEEGLRMVIAPKLVDMVQPSVEAEDRLVELRDPDGKRHTQIEMKTAVGVEYLQGGARRMSVDTFNHTAAYCIQMLRVAFDKLCWAEID